MTMPCRRAPLALAFLLVGLLFAGSTQAAPRAAELGPEVAITEPSGGYVGRLEVSPSHGPVGTPLTVTGEGFAPGQDIEVVWRTVKGRWKVTQAEYFGREFNPAAYRIATVKTDAAGRLTANFVAPEDFGFQHDIVVQRGKRLLTQTAFHLDMTVRLTGPSSGPIGTPIGIEITGIGWRELEGSWVLLYDNKFTGFMSVVTTGGTARFDLPATGHVGRHIIEIQHSDFGSPYRNTQQSPVPDRPVFHLTFTITPGDPVLPPPAAAQAQTQARSLPSQGDLVATPAFAGVGAPVSVRGGGFEPGKVYELNWNTVVGNRMSGRGWEEKAKVVAQARADAAGQAEFRFDVPDDLGGVHRLWIDAGGYKGKETRPNNYRLPQLTFADDHPGEDLPRFRFAFEVTPDTRGAQVQQ